MPVWTDVAALGEFPPGTRRVVDVDGAPVVVFNIGGAIHAVEDVCTHDGGELASGELDGDIITCPRHGARFSVKNGAVLAPPAYEALHVFPVRLEQGRVQVRDDRWD